MKNMQRVVITGIAPIAAIGVGKDEFFKNLYEKHAVLERIPEGYCNQYSPATGWYVPYPKINYKDFGQKVRQIMGKAPVNAMTSVVSSILALEDAGIENIEGDTAVVMGVGMDNMPEVTDGIKSAVYGKKMYPLIVPLVMSNAVSAWISIILGLHAENKVVATACASGTSAIGEAYRLIAGGHAKMAICGGADCAKGDHGMMLQGFDHLGVLSKSEDGYPCVFSKERSGFLFSEGAACCLILEKYEAAVNRNANIYAEITGYETNCDGFHIVTMPEDPIYAKDMIRRLSSIKVDYYNAHGTGTEMNDLAERDIITSVYGNIECQPYINSTKGIIGHTIGASGAVEAAVCAHAIGNSKIHGNILKTPMEGLNLPEKTFNCSINCAVSASFGFGGHNAALRLEKIK